MKTKTAIFAAAVLILGILGFAWHCWRTASIGRESLAALNQDIGGQQAELSQVRERADTRERDLALLRTKAATPRTGPPAAKTAAKTAVPAVVVDPATRMETDPKFRDLYLRQWRANLAQKHRLMYLRLGLDETAIAKFEELAAAHEDDLITLRAAARAHGFNAPGTVLNVSQAPKAVFFNAGANPDASLATLIKQSDEAYYAQLAAALGPEASAAAAQNDRIGDVHVFVGEVDMRRSSGEQDLTPTQVAQLSQILLAASPAYQKGGTARLDDIDWDQAMVPAAALLPEPQFRAFKARADFYNLGKKVRAFRAKQK